MPFTFACTLIFVQIDFKLCQIQGGAQLFLSFATIIYFKLETWKVIPKESADQFELYAVCDKSTNWLDYFLYYGSSSFIWDQRAIIL